MKLVPASAGTFSAWTFLPHPTLSSRRGLIPRWECGFSRSQRPRWECIPEAPASIFAFCRYRVSAGTIFRLTQLSTQGEGVFL